MRLAGGLIGRKAGEGFYTYVDGQKQVPAETPAPALPQTLKIWVSPKHPEGYARATALLEKLGAPLISGSTPAADALIIVTPYGEDVHRRLGAGPGSGPQRGPGHAVRAGRRARRSLMLSPATQPQWRDAAHAALAADGVPVTVIQDSPGFVAQRIVATIVNIACDIAQQQIATPEDIDRAVTLGLGYPTARWRWATRWARRASWKCSRTSSASPATSAIVPACGCNAACNWACRCWSRRRLDGQRIGPRAQARVDATRRLHRARAGKDVGIVAIDADGFRRLPTKNLWSARFLQARRCRRKLGLLKSIRSQLGLGPRSMMRVAPGKPKSPSASRCWISCQVSCQAVEPFMSSRTRVAKPGSDCVKR